LEASLIYKVSSRTARATQRNPVSKKQSKTKTKQKKNKHYRLVSYTRCILSLELQQYNMTKNKDSAPYFSNYLSHLLLPIEGKPC